MLEPRSRCVTILACATLGGCFEVDGGAAELSWSLFDYGGDAINCARADLAEVRLCWAPLDADGDRSESCRIATRDAFECGALHGVTGFELTSGPTAFWIEPTCADGEAAAPESIQVPPPIVRTVEIGGVVTLGSLVIIASDNQDEEPMCGPSDSCTCGE